MTTYFNPDFPKDRPMATVAKVIPVPVEKRPRLYSLLTWQENCGGYWNLEYPRVKREDIDKFDMDPSLGSRPEIIEIPGEGEVSELEKAARAILLALENHLRYDPFWALHIEYLRKALGVQS